MSLAAVKQAWFVLASSRLEAVLLLFAVDGIMFLVGLTGGIATGKSLVSSILMEDDVAVIDCDEIARLGKLVP